MRAVNNGPAASRNKGIEISKGQFIFFLDADDYLESDAIKLLVEHHNKHKAGLTIGDFRKIKNDRVEQRNDISFSENKLLSKEEITAYSRNYLKRPNKYLLFAFSWGRLFKSSIIKNNGLFFNADLRTFEDVAFNFDYLNYADEVFFLKEPVYNHLVYDDFSSATMTMGDNPRKLFGYKQALINIGDYLKNKIPEADIKKEIGHADVSLTIIQSVRLCGQIGNNQKAIFKFIRELVNDKNFRNNLQFYSPSKGDSKIIPLLMKLKLIAPLIRLCQYKAAKRYKNKVK